MKPTVTTISTGYHTEEGDIVEFFYTEDGFGGREIEIKSEVKIKISEITEFSVDFTDRINRFLGEMETKVNYEFENNHHDD